MTWLRPLCVLNWNQLWAFASMAVERSSNRPGSAWFLIGNCLKVWPCKWEQPGKTATGFSACAQSANTSLQEMSPQTQLLLSAHFRGLYTYLLSHGNNSWKTEWEARSTWLSCSSSPIQQLGFSPWGSVIWQKGSIWKHFFIIQIAALSLLQRWHTYPPLPAALQLAGGRTVKANAFFLFALKSPCFKVVSSASTRTWLTHPFLPQVGSPYKWIFRPGTGLVWLVVCVTSCPETPGCNLQDNRSGRCSLHQVFTTLALVPASTRKEWCFSTTYLLTLPFWDCKIVYPTSIELASFVCKTHCRF